MLLYVDSDHIQISHSTSCLASSHVSIGPTVKSKQREASIEAGTVKGRSARGGMVDGPQLRGVVPRGVETRNGSRGADSRGDEPRGEEPRGEDPRGASLPGGAPRVGLGERRGVECRGVAALTDTAARFDRGDGTNEMEAAFGL